MGDQDHSAEVPQYIVDTGYEILREETLEELSSLVGVITACTSYYRFLLPIFFNAIKISRR